MVNKNKLIHTYLMPGMAASPIIFEHINLPEETFKIHWLEWLIPNKNESLQSYALRITKDIKHANPVLIGVSFGGILVQEMAKHITVKKVIIISSVKSHTEFPKRIKFAKSTKVYKLMPTSILSRVTVLERFAFGKFATKRIELYKKYMSVNNKQYLDWAIKQVVFWEQEMPMQNLIHIHGDKDLVFPINNIKECITINQGTHVMIINKYKWFNKNLPTLILN